MGNSSNYTAANMGGVKRGDRDETGDLEAQPDEGVNSADLNDTDFDNLTVLDATDPSLGLTNIGDIPADDWAADTGPTHSAEEESPGHKH